MKTEVFYCKFIVLLMWGNFFCWAKRSTDVQNDVFFLQKNTLWEERSSTSNTVCKVFFFELTNNLTTEFSLLFYKREDIFFLCCTRRVWEREPLDVVSPPHVHVRENDLIFLECKKSVREEAHWWFCFSPCARAWE